MEKEKVMSSYERERLEYRNKFVKWLSLGILGLVLLIAMFAVAGPPYRVWSSEMKGKAEYMRAEQNRRIKVEEAKANLDAEKLNAQAEIERAKGAAEAIKIENGSLTPTYIQYLWVRQQNASTNNRIIYIPTEAGLPVLEAGRAK
jgi:hypothetical protein